MDGSTPHSKVTIAVVGNISVASCGNKKHLHMCIMLQVILCMGKVPEQINIKTGALGQCAGNFLCRRRNIIVEIS